MTPLHQWARDYQISQQALQALLVTMGLDYPADVPAGAMHLTSEAGVQQQVRLAAARRGDMLLWRNNSGACKDEKGRMIRWGLANDSKEMNEKIKSSDLIGITTVTDPMSGWRYGVFTSLEAKHPGWRMTPGDKRAQAQLRFGQQVIMRGGIFRFINDPTQIQEI